MDEEEDKSFCFIEGTPIDKSAAADATELHENIWYRMKPPKRATVMYAPFVSARQIDLIRNMILGRTPLTMRAIEVKPECYAREQICDLPERRSIIVKPCLKVKKSSVRYLNKSAYD